MSRYQAEGFAPITPNEIAFERVIQRVVHGGILRQLGEIREAERSFHFAEQLQKATWPDLPVLFSIWGARYCRLLVGDILTGDKFDAPRYEHMVCRINEMRRVGQEARRMRIPRGNWGPLEEALEQEVIAVAKARLSLAQGRSFPPDAAADINSAVEKLRTTGRQDFICGGLLTRSTLRWEMKMDDYLARAQSDLDEAWQIAERGSMRLYMADIWLHRGRLFRDKAALAKAREIINKCGYHRRDGELADAEADFANLSMQHAMVEYLCHQLGEYPWVSIGEKLARYLAYTSGGQINFADLAQLASRFACSFDEVHKIVEVLSHPTNGFLERVFIDTENGDREVSVDEISERGRGVFLEETVPSSDWIKWSDGVRVIWRLKHSQWRDSCKVDSMQHGRSES
jgi:hypothetical protein